jgi:hypothetical protein
MQAGASNVATLLIGRIIGGFAIGRVSFYFLDVHLVQLCLIVIDSILSMTVPLYNVSGACQNSNRFRGWH